MKIGVLALVCLYLFCAQIYSVNLNINIYPFQSIVINQTQDSIEYSSTSIFEVHIPKGDLISTNAKYQIIEIDSMCWYSIIPK